MALDEKIKKISRNIGLSLCTAAMASCGGNSGKAPTSPESLAPLSSVTEPSCTEPEGQGVPRCSLKFTSGVIQWNEPNFAYLDNASSMPNNEAAALVLEADRSTRSSSPNQPKYQKGLIGRGDRVCVTDKYIAWFDYTRTDGAAFDAPYENDVARSGTIAGIWTLDPATRSFKHQLPSTDGSGGTWARNELIPGSASQNGEQHWWDIYSAPVEHSFMVPIQNDPKTNHYFFSYHLATNSKKSGWTISKDGERSAAGVHYLTEALMTGTNGSVDTIDGEDNNDIKNSVRSSLEYICTPDDIRMVWKFMPEKEDVEINLAYVGLWVAYSVDIDNTSCDTAPGEQWPNTDYGQPRFMRSSELLVESQSPSAFRYVQPGEVGNIVVQQPACNLNPDRSYHNTGGFTLPDGAARTGSWIEIGEDAQMAGASRSMRLTMLNTPMIGAGTAESPLGMMWNDLNVWNENLDGTTGFGVGNGFKKMTLKKGIWYESNLSISTR